MPNNYTSTKTSSTIELDSGQDYDRVRFRTSSIVELDSEQVTIKLNSEQSSIIDLKSDLEQVA
ncbi:3953_t:CDS:2 [Cetraspora pellucida]|uniref:3953_t:CDS:1 n=1 Tax=Cetraspora pellucida TaxID=1433469 RepID=A0A9N9N6H3_9GLOM|nr:3953_t:CDS:2 [Cetraspora pellucida]